MTAMLWTVAFRVGASVAISGLCISGCASSSINPSSTMINCASTTAPLALAVGARANTPSPDLYQVSDLITDAANAQEKITLVRIDGSPRIVYSQAFVTDAGNPTSRQSGLNAYLQGIERVFAGNIHAVVPGADVIMALNLAAQSAGPGGNVVIIDSGLQTVGPLNFRTDDLLEASPTDVVTFLHRSHALPDLNDRHVIFVGLGDTASPQRPLDLREQQNVINIWLQIARAGGAACVGVDPAANDSPALTDVPSVGVVAVSPPP